MAVPSGFAAILSGVVILMVTWLGACSRQYCSAQCSVADADADAYALRRPAPTRKPQSAELRGPGSGAWLLIVRKNRMMLILGRAEGDAQLAIGQISIANPSVCPRGASTHCGVDEVPRQRKRVDRDLPHSV